MTRDRNQPTKRLCNGIELSNKKGQPWIHTNDGWIIKIWSEQKKSRVKEGSSDILEIKMRGGFYWCLTFSSCSQSLQHPCCALQVCCFISPIVYVQIMYLPILLWGLAQPCDLIHHMCLLESQIHMDLGNGVEEISQYRTSWLVRPEAQRF